MKKIKDIICKYYSKYKEIFNYVVFGVLTTLVNYLVYAICAKTIKIDVVISTSIAWLISVLFAYITNKKYVFNSKTNKIIDIVNELVSFFLFRILSGILDIIFMYVSVNLMNLNDLFMKLISNFVVIALNYLFSKLFVFNDEKKQSKKDNMTKEDNCLKDNIFKYIIQLAMITVVILIFGWNFNIYSIVLVIILFVFCEIILKNVAKQGEKGKDKKMNVITKIKNFMFDKFHYIIFICAFVIRLVVYLKLQIVPRSDFAAVLNAAKELVNGINIMNTSSYFIMWGYQTGMVIYDAVVIGILGIEMWLHIFDCLYGAGICLFIYLIAKEIFSKKSAICVSVFYCIGIYVSAFCGVLSNHHIYTIILLIAIYLIVAKRYNNMNNLLKYTIVATLLAIANIFRSESIVYVLAVIAYVFVNAFSKKEWKKGLYTICTVVLVYIIIGKSASYIIKATGLNQSGLENKDTLWKFVCGTDYRVNGGYSNEGTKYIGNTELELEYIKNNLKSLSLKQKIELVNNKEKEFWSNIPYYWVFYELEGKSVNIFGVNCSFSGILEYIKMYDKTLFLICVISMLILVVYGKITKDEDKRLYLFYLMILANFCAYIFIEVSGRYSYIAKVIVYILAAGGIDCLKKLGNKQIKGNEYKTEN